MSKNSHFAAGLAWRRGEDGKIEVLVLDSYKSERGWLTKHNAQIKFPGGTNREFGDEPVLDTLHREFVGETGMRFPDNPVPIYEPPPRQSDTGKGLHSQHFFISHESDLKGKLRTEVLNDNGDWLSPPYWIDADLLMQIIFRTHKPALQALLSHLEGGGLTPPPRPVTQ